MLGNNVIISTGSGLAGHVIVEDDTIIGGHSGVKQRVHIGRGAMVGGKSAVLSDVLPYTLVAGNPACFQGLNLVGLRRRGSSREEMRALAAWCRVAYPPASRALPPPLSLHERVRQACAAGLGDGVEGAARAAHLRDFLLRPLPRGICQAPVPGGNGTVTNNETVAG